MAFGDWLRTKTGKTVASAALVVTAGAGIGGGLAATSGSSAPAATHHQAGAVTQVTTVGNAHASDFTSNISVPKDAEDIPVKITATFDIGGPAIIFPANYTPPTMGPYEGPANTAIPEAYKAVVHSDLFVPDSNILGVDFNVQKPDGAKLTMEEGIAQFKTLLAATQPQAPDSPSINFTADTDATITIQDGKVTHSSITPEQLAQLEDLNNGGTVWSNMNITVIDNGKPVQASIAPSASVDGVNSNLEIVYPADQSAKESKSLIESQEKTADVLNGWLTGQLQSAVGKTGIYVQVSTTDNETYALISNKWIERKSG